MMGQGEQISRKWKMDEMVTEKVGWREWRLETLVEGNIVEGWQDTCQPQLTWDLETPGATKGEREKWG